MKKVTVWWCVWVACFFVACSSGPQDNANQNNVSNKDYSTNLETTTKSFTVSYGEIKGSDGMSYDAIPFNKIFSMTLTIKPATGASVSSEKLPSISAIMPEHKHGMNTNPVIESAQEGQYKVTGMLLHMPGWWTISVEVPNANGEMESVTFNVMLDVK